MHKPPLLFLCSGHDNFVEAQTELNSQHSFYNSTPWFRRGVCPSWTRRTNYTAQLPAQDLSYRLGDLSLFTGGCRKRGAWITCLMPVIGTNPPLGVQYFFSTPFLESLASRPEQILHGEGTSIIGSLSLF